MSASPRSPQLSETRPSEEPAAAGAEDELLSPLQRVSSHIREGLRTGRYKGGDKLVEREIARELGLSRGAVREAIQILIGQRLLQREKQRSARIREMSEQDVLAVIEVLEMVGSLGARLAAERIKRRDNSARFMEAVGRVVDTVKGGNRATIRQNSQSLWLTMLEIGENPYLQNVSDALLIELYNEQIFDTVLQVAPDYCEWLDSIGRTICSGDPELAEDTYRRFQNWLYALIREKYRLARNVGK